PRPICLSIMRLPPSTTLFPYTTLFRSHCTTTPNVTDAGHGNMPREKLMRIRCPVCYTEHALEAILEDEAARELMGVLADLPRERSEEHTSELQSRENLVCRLLLEKKKK